MDENKPRRRWLSFGIRDLLWAMVVAGVALGWCAHASRLGRQISLERKNSTKLALWVTMLGKNVEYDPKGEAVVK
jgi:hypothetical protein